MVVSFNYNSSRARKARLAARISPATRYGEYGAMAILTAGTLALLWQHHAAGCSLFGLDLLVSCLLIWQIWDLQELETQNVALNTETIQLDRVLEEKLLARLRPDSEPEAIWEALAHQWEGVFVLERLVIPFAVVRDGLSRFNLSSQDIWQAAAGLAIEVGAGEVDSGLVAVAILRFKELNPLLEHLKVREADLGSVVRWQQRVKQAIRKHRHKPYFGGLGRSWAQGYTPLLANFSANLSQEIEAGYYRNLPSVHQPVIDQLIAELTRNRPVALVGRPGSGRTSLMYSLAEQLLTAKSTQGLDYYQIMALDSAAIISAAAKAEDLITRLLVEAAQAKNTILFFDEAQLFFSTGVGAIDLSQLLLPILQRNALKIVFAMSDHDWQELAKRQPSLTSSLSRIIVAEPPETETVAVLQDAALGIEQRAKGVVTQSAITEAIRLAGRYLPESAFPGKAITVLESAANYPENGLITAISVQQAIQSTTGAKVAGPAPIEKKQLLNLEDQIHQRMINQDRAVKTVAEALRRSRAGVSSQKRPIGSFLFLGPTGVGKTELARALAAIYYGGENAMIRLDMSEYQQTTDVGRLLDHTSSSKSGQTLVSAVRQNPSTLVLLDEVEKAHPEVLNLLLQLLDEGKLTDSDGREVSFRDAIIIATSNAQAEQIRQRIAKGEQLAAFEPKIIDELIATKAFKPELLNRFDEIVVFRPLTKPELRRVVGLLLDDVNKTLAQNNVHVSVTPAAADWLVEQGYDPTFGARPLRRMVQRTVENVAAERLLAGQLQPGQTLNLDIADLADKIK